MPGFIINEKTLVMDLILQFGVPFNAKINHSLLY